MTNSQKQLSRRYILYKLFTNLWFTSAVWVYFFRLFVNDQQIGTLDGVAFAIGLLAEVPSGALADKFGRDKLVRVGLTVTGTGLLIMAIGGNFFPLILGTMLQIIGTSLVSGADDALFFENLHFNSHTKDWQKLVTRSSQIALAGTILATIVGAWLYTINPHLPIALSGVGFFVAASLLMSVKDSRPKKARQEFIVELLDYLGDIKTGFKEFLKPQLKPYVMYIITVQGLFYFASYGLLRLLLLDRFGFSPFHGSIVIAICGITTVILFSFMHKNAGKLHERNVLLTIGISAALGLLFAVANIGYWGFCVMLALYAGQHLLQPFMSEVLNLHAPEEKRATVLSVASFLKSAPYVVFAPVIGYLNVRGQLGYFLVGWSVLIGLAIIIYLSVKKRDTLITIETD